MGPIIIMSTIHITNKGRLVDTMEKFYIFREANLDNQTNDKLHWTTNFKTFFVSVMNMLLIYLFVSMKL
jgi:predicted choloylglycine hydrolase